MLALLREKVRPIALTLAFPVMGFLICLALGTFLDVEIPRLTSSVINLAITAFAAFVLFPRVFGIPFGRVSTRTFNRRVGLYLPRGYWRHVLLGVVLATCTLSAMLAASLLTGRYSLDWGVIGPAHLVFSLNPGIWEEVFYRGVMMLLLLGMTKSLKWAAVLQVVLFGLAHIKGTDLIAFVDVISVMVIAVGFTYVAYRTGSLVAGIVFHYLHDALLYVVQPAGGYSGVAENLVFYGLLWLGVAAGCFLTKVAVDRLGVRVAGELYVRG